MRLTIGGFYHNIQLSKDLDMEEKQETFTPTNEMTVGEIFYNARTTGRRKREISTIAKLLCIREDFLEALESGKYRVIPEDVYILGFARSYAVELGLNPDEIIEKLKRELGIMVHQDEEKEPEKRQEPTKPKRKLKINKDCCVNFCKQSFVCVKKHWIWFVGGLVLLLSAIVIGAVLLSGKKDSGQDIVVPEEIAVPVVDTTTQPVVEKPGPDFRFPVREKFNEKLSKESRVVLQAEKESWIKIEDARGSTVFSRVLVPGDVYYMPLSDKFKGTFGNAGGIDVWVDGQLVNKVGPANTRKTGFSMAPDALKAAGLAE